MLYILYQINTPIFIYLNYLYIKLYIYRDRDDFRIDLQIKITSKDPIFYAVIDKNTGIIIVVIILCIILILYIILK